MTIYDNRPDKVKVIGELKAFTVDELVGEINDNNYQELDDNDYTIKVFDNAYFEEDMVAPLFRLIELDELQSTAQVLVMHIFPGLIVLVIA
ncbi:MAG: hypothetical protein ACI4MN_04120 [Candidatus Coproplasma sp.]